MILFRAKSETVDYTSEWMSSYQECEEWINKIISNKKFASVLGNKFIIEAMMAGED